MMHRLLRFASVLVCMVAVSGVRLEIQRIRPCDSDSQCTTVRRCPYAIALMRSGVAPQVCGFVRRRIPLVCCLIPQPSSTSTTTPIPFLTLPPPQPRDRNPAISDISPNDCGFRSPTADAESNLLGLAQPRNDESTTQTSEEGTLLVRVFAVGGQNATQKWPWMVALYDKDKRKQLCGGTLVDERHVITAAHCFDGKSLEPRQYTVQVGNIDLDDGTPHFGVQEVRVHEAYRPFRHYDDIAILRLANALDTQMNTPACLPRQGTRLEEGRNVTVLGWGDLEYGGRSSNTLQEVHGLPVVDNGRCNAKFRTIARRQFPRGITTTFLCAGLEEGGKDACQGDSGGPLLHQSKGYVPELPRRLAV